MLKSPASHYRAFLMAHILRELLEAVVLALAVFFIIQVSVQNFRVEGHSMQPTLETDEFLMVNKLGYFRIDMERLARLVPFWDVEPGEHRYIPLAHPPERNDIVVFHAPIQDDKDFVKRVVGVPGDKVVIKQGTVSINGVVPKIPEMPGFGQTEVGDVELLSLAGPGCSTTWQDWQETRRSEEPQVCVLQEDQYFVLGDNRTKSSDSRDWGPVSLERIIGKVWFIYWPFSKLPWADKLANRR